MRLQELKLKIDGEKFTMTASNDEVLHGITKQLRMVVPMLIVEGATFHADTLKKHPWIAELVEKS